MPHIIIRRRSTVNPVELILQRRPERTSEKESVRESRARKKKKKSPSPFLVVSSKAVVRPWPYQSVFCIADYQMRNVNVRSVNSKRRKTPSSSCLWVSQFRCFVNNSTYDNHTCFLKPDYYDIVVMVRNYINLWPLSYYILYEHAYTHIEHTRNTRVGGKESLSKPLLHQSSSNISTTSNLRFIEQICRIIIFSWKIFP